MKYKTFKPHYETVLLESCKEAKKLGLTKLTAQVKINRKTSLEFEMKTGWVKKGIIYKNNKPYAFSLEKSL